MFNIRVTLEIEIGRKKKAVAVVSSRVSWVRLRELVKNRDHAICHYCSRYAEDGAADHVVPLVRGGTDALDNLVWACSQCNQSKGGKLAEEWLASQPVPPVPVGSVRITVREVDRVEQRRQEWEKFLQLVATDSSTPSLEQAGYPRRSRIEPWRDKLMAAGWAAWKDEQNHKQGWYLVDKPEVVLEEMRFSPAGA